MGEAQQLGDGDGDVGGVDDAPPHGVVDVVVDVGDLVGQAHHLPLPGLGALRPGVAQDAVPHLPGEVQPVPLLLQPVHHPQGLLVVLEAPGHDLAQQPLPRVPEGGVPQVVAQGDGLGEVLVEAQAPGDGAGDAADLQGVGHPGAVVIPLRLEEHLGLVLQPPEGVGVDDAVGVPLEAGAHLALLLRPGAAPALRGQDGPRGQELPLPLFALLPKGHGSHRLSAVFSYYLYTIYLAKILLN